MKQAKNLRRESVAPYLSAGRAMKWIKRMWEVISPAETLSPMPARYHYWDSNGRRYVEDRFHADPRWRAEALRRGYYDSEGRPLP